MNLWKHHEEDRFSPRLVSQCMAQNLFLCSQPLLKIAFFSWDRKSGYTDFFNTVSIIIMWCSLLPQLLNISRLLTLPGA